MQKALFVGLIVSLLSGLVSVFIVLRKMSFIGAGISHAAFGGIAIGFLAGINPIFTAILYSIAVALGIEFISRKGKVSEGCLYRHILCKLNGSRYCSDKPLKRI